MTPDLAAGSTFGPYRLESLLGRGGMSVVYLAEDTRLGRRVAIKVLAPELATDEAFRSRFVRESQLAAGLEHPNIVPVYEAGEADGQLFIAMRYVRGTDLRALVVREGPLDPHRTVALLRPVASALDVAHRRGLVHRDVKPANILIATDEDEEHVYLSDFGLTKHTTSRSGLTRTGQFMGTVDYVAPEQIQGQEVDGRADGYSLACVLFECLTATVPFHKDTDVATLFGHIQDPPPKATGSRPELPAQIDGVIARGMAKDRDERPGTCSALIDEAGRALGAPSGPREAPSVASPTPAGSTAAPVSATPPTGPLPPGEVPPAQPAPPVPPPPGGRPGGGGSNTRTIAIAGGLVAVIAAVVLLAVFVLGGSDDPGPGPSPSPTGGTESPSPSESPVAPTVAANADPITIADIAPATPYPSTIEVSDAGVTVGDVEVTLSGFSHDFADDVDVLLVGPGGQAVVLMSDVGGIDAVGALDLTFDDEASESLPDEGPLASGTFRPTAGVQRGNSCCDFEGPTPAPAPPYDTALSVFDGTDPNGEWNLFVFDDTTGDVGDVAGGWSIEIAPPGAAEPTETASPSSTASPTSAVVSTTDPISISEFEQADPYPSTIEVSGLAGTVVDVKVTLLGLSHAFPEDLDVLLVGPTGESVVLMADLGGGTDQPIEGVSITFDDAASEVAPDRRQITSGTFRPTTGDEGLGDCCGFQGTTPAPSPPYGQALAVFAGTDPNGTWSLFVYDDTPGDAGQIAGGWRLDIAVSER